MNKFLASVNSLEEALLVNQIGVDIIDLKQPELGALGALDSSSIRQIVSNIAGSCPISATIGDLPMTPELLYTAAATMTDQGVDFIKLGFFPSEHWLACLAALAPLAAQGHQLIAVLFADTQPPLSIIEHISNAGFSGVMLDTMHKQQGSLTDVMPYQRLAEFVETAQRYQLICGLAGSLKITDIAKLKPLQPDYLGFRGALCIDQQRTAKINSDAIWAIKHALNF